MPEVPEDEESWMRFLKPSFYADAFVSAVSEVGDTINADDSSAADKSIGLEILAGNVVSNNLIGGAAVDQNALEVGNPELELLLGDPAKSETVLSYPQNIFQDDVNHMILFQMFEKEDERERLLNRTVERSGAGDDLQEYLQEQILQKSGTTVVDGITQDVYQAKFNRSDFFGGTDGLGGMPRFGSRLGSDDIDRITGIAEKSLSRGDSTSRDFLGNPTEYKFGNNNVRRGNNAGRSSARPSDYKANFRPPFVNRGLATTPKYKAKQNIFLYMPQTINETNLQSYDTPELLLAKFASETLKNTLAEGGKGFVGVGASFEELVEELSKNTSIATRLGAGAIDGLANILGLPLNAEAVLTQLRGKALNPRREQTYQSPEFRTFSYVFELYPKSRAETDMINSMIRLFKYHSYPDLDTTGNLFITPALFRIRYLYKSSGALVENIWLNRTKDCVLTEVNVDYTAPGKFTTHADGSPVGIKLSLTFKETTVVTKEDVLDGA